MGSSTQGLVSAITSGPVLTLGNQAYTANSAGEFVVGSQTIAPGSPAVTISGTPISVEPQGTEAVVGSSTQELGGTISSRPVLTVSTRVYTANSAGEFIIGSQTVVPGSPAVTISGTPISVAPQGTEAVVGSSTEGLGGAILSGFRPGPTTSPGAANGGGEGSGGGSPTASTLASFIPGSGSGRSVGEASMKRGWVIGLLGLVLGVWNIL